MNYFAHSPKDGVEAQTYAAHIRGVCHLADRFGREAGKYSKSDGEALRRLVEKAAEYHDIGKLDEKNQAVLSGKVKAKSLSGQSCGRRSRTLAYAELSFSAGRISDTGSSHWVS